MQFQFCNPQHQGLLPPALEEYHNPAVPAGAAPVQDLAVAKAGVDHLHARLRWGYTPDKIGFYRHRAPRRIFESANGNLPFILVAGRDRSCPRSRAAYAAAVAD